MASSGLDRARGAQLSKVERLRTEHEQNLAIIERMYYTKKEELQRDVKLWEDSSPPAAPKPAWGEDHSDLGWQLDEADADMGVSAQVNLDAGPAYVPEPEPWTPTVPVPFSFDSDKSKKETIAQRRAREEREMRVMIEEEECKQTFRPTPVPTDCLSSSVGKLERMEAAAEIQRELRKQQYKASLKHCEFNLTETKPKAAPAKPKAKPFKANQIPFSSSIAGAEASKKKIEAQERSRRNKAIRHGMKLAQEAKLPDRMELDKQRLEYAQAVGTVPYDAHECTFTPQINHDIPDFELRHREFQETLLAAKATKVPTDPEAFNLLTSKMKDRIPEILEDMARDSIILKENRWPYVSTRAPVPSSERNESFRLKNREPLYPPELCSSAGPSQLSKSQGKGNNKETKAARLRREHAQKTLREREEQAHKKKQANDDILAKQKKVNMRLTKKLNATKKKGDDVNRARAAARAQQRRQLAEFAQQEKAKLDAKISAQPPVWERTRDDAMKQRALDDIQEAMMSTGADTVAPIVGSSDWK